jgi:hypothetical protein
VPQKTAALLEFIALEAGPKKQRLSPISSAVRTCVKVFPTVTWQLFCEHPESKHQRYAVHFLKLVFQWQQNFKH